LIITATKDFPKAREIVLTIGETGETSPTTGENTGKGKC